MKQSQQVYVDYFNSHPHEEDDSVLTFWNMLPFDISTHILTKRMTGHLVALVDSIYFNSHPHEEDDNGDALIISTIVYFNSHPHEEDDRRALCY